MNGGENSNKKKKERGLVLTIKVRLHCVTLTFTRKSHRHEIRLPVNILRYLIAVEEIDGAHTRIGTWQHTHTLGRQQQQQPAIDYVRKTDQADNRCHWCMKRRQGSRPPPDSLCVLWKNLDSLCIFYYSKSFNGTQLSPLYFFSLSYYFPQKRERERKSVGSFEHSSTHSSYYLGSRWFTNTRRPPPTLSAGLVLLLLTFFKAQHGDRSVGYRKNSARLNRHVPHLVKQSI